MHNRDARQRRCLRLDNTSAGSTFLRPWAQVLPVHSVSTAECTVFAQCSGGLWTLVGAMRWQPAVP